MRFVTMQYKHVFTIPGISIWQNVASVTGSNYCPEAKCSTAQYKVYNNTTVSTHLTNYGLPGYWYHIIYTVIFDKTADLSATKYIFNYF